MADLQVVVVDNDTLHQQRQNGLLVGDRGGRQARADARAEGLEIGEHALCVGPLATQPRLLLALLVNGLPALRDRVPTLRQFLEGQDAGLIGVHEAAVFAPEPL